MVRRMTRLPEVEFLHITAVRSAGDHALWLRFSDGVEGIADLSGSLDGPVFQPLRDPDFFARAELEGDYTVAWPNGVDLAPEFLYERTMSSGAIRKRNLAEAFDDAETEYAAQCDRMPEMSRFFGIIIRMFWDEHARPHFHARYGRQTLTVNIHDGLVTTHGFPSAKLHLVLEWHAQRRRELLDNWERMRRDEPPLTIAPLE
jgi:hypothetical protein